MSLLTPPSKVRWGLIVASSSVLLISLTACGTPAVTPASAAPAESETAQSASSPSILLFVGTGTSSTDVTAVETILSTNKLAYATANSAQLDDMSQSELMAYKLLIVPGGNSITIGEGLTSTATNTVHDAVQQGLHYLGICAGGFFGGYSEYNGLNLTSGVWFNFYEDYNEGIYKAAVEVSQPNGTELDQYWQDGPQFTGWGNIVGKYSNGTPAIVEGKSGNGWVILAGIHAEAPASWRIGMTFTTPVQTDNAYAYTLINAALNGTSLAHY
ncbi:MAG TPA: BPL-N domain-containing protein [Candidatus Aquilonibacter sp.]|nr:BPL-N domain-containing protein [Candidatus Aquilonibacter sp.]